MSLSNEHNPKPLDSNISLPKLPASSFSLSPVSLSFEEATLATFHMVTNALDAFEVFDDLRKDLSFIEIPKSHWVVGTPGQKFWDFFLSDKLSVIPWILAKAVGVSFCDKLENGEYFLQINDSCQSFARSNIARFVAYQDVTHPILERKTLDDSFEKGRTLAKILLKIWQERLISDFKRMRGDKDIRTSVDSVASSLKLEVVKARQDDKGEIDLALQVSKDFFSSVSSLELLTAVYSSSLKFEQAKSVESFSIDTKRLKAMQPYLFDTDRRVDSQLLSLMSKNEQEIFLTAEGKAWKDDIKPAFFLVKLIPVYLHFLVKTTIAPGLLPAEDVDTLICLVEKSKSTSDNDHFKVLSNIEDQLELRKAAA